MASTYLTRTPSSAGNRDLWTWSGWIKRATLSTNQKFFTCGNSSLTFMSIQFNANDTLGFNDNSGGSTISNITTNQVFRDVSAWYHIVAIYDSGNATSTDRLRLYVNGSRVTSLTDTTFPAPNTDGLVNSTTVHNIGQRGDGNHYFDGEMSHVHFIDGTAYDASYFGETDANGVWTIKTSPSVTYGTNGFFILKDGNSVTDQSGNGNNWTVAGGTLTNTLDCPDNVFATMNPLDFHNNAPTLSNGNLTVASSSSNSPIRATMGFSKGKWYAEYRFEASDNDNHIGCHSLETSLTLNYTGGETYSWGLVTSSGDKRNNNVSTSYGSAIGYSNSIVMIAIDKDNGKIWWGKDGTWFASGDPANGTNEAFSNINTVVGADGFVTFSDTTYRNGSWNFGNGYFGTTPVASAGTNASGIGIFEYDVPTGYTALSTKGLNL